MGFRTHAVTVPTFDGLDAAVFFAAGAFSGLISHAVGNAALAHRLLPSRRPLASESRRVPMTPERAHAPDEVLRRVQGEFLEMPGLRLTERQARRLWGLDAASCDALLGALVDAKFLFRTRDGAFMRVEHATPVKATVRPSRQAAVA